MNIGQAARASGVSAKMIRYYERVGLLSPAGRTRAGYRVFSDDDVHALRFVRRARDLGFPVADIVQLLSLWRDRDRESGKVKELARAHLTELRAKMQELQAMAATLERLVTSCDGDERPSCPIIDELADDA